MFSSCLSKKSLGVCRVGNSGSCNLCCLFVSSLYYLGQLLSIPLPFCFGVFSIRKLAQKKTLISAFPATFLKE